MAKKFRVLYVEDESIAAMLMEMELKKIGYETAPHVATGEEAIESVRLNRPDIVLMDIRLAGTLDGIETATLIKAETNTPIIFLSGYQDQEMSKRAWGLSPVDYLTKPVEMAVLDSIIRRYLEPCC